MRQSLSKSRQSLSEQRIGAPFVRLLCGYVRQHGYRPHELFGAPLADDDEISVARWHELLAMAATSLDDPAIGLAIAQHATWRDFGLVGYLAWSCATVGEALERGSRYTPLIVQRNQTEFRIEDNLVCLSWPTQRAKTQQHADAVGIGVIVATLRFVIGNEFTPARVDFIASPPAQVDVYERYFGCPVYFDQAATRLCFDKRYLELPLPNSDPALLALLDEQANARLQKLVPLTGELQQLRFQLVQLIRQGKTRLKDLAEINHTSTRALQRRLHEHNSSFQILLDETRLHLAQEYLADAEIDLLTVANLVGYSEQSSFTRAFQQWTGSTPGQWRAARITANLS